MRSWKAVGGLLLAGALCTSVWAAPNLGPQPVPRGPQQGSQFSPQPGMVNYIEGQASIAGTPLTQNSVGSRQLQAGESLATQNGRAELLLTPGVLLRLDSNSAVQMNSPDIADTALTLQGGRAMVEADGILPANHMTILEGPATVRIMRNGLYDFDATHGQFRVFDGRAEVTVAGRTFTVQSGHEFDLNAAKLKARGFDKKASEDDFYRWGSLRSSYLAEANADAARGFSQGYYSQGPAYPGYGYAGYYGAYDPGWFWDPYFDAYTWLPYDGIFFSPFGWGFYSPGFAYAAPYGRGGFGRGGYHAFGPGYRPSVAAARGVATGRVAGNAFAGGGFRGGTSGQFRSAAGSGGGGFHGGGFGGGGGPRR